MTSPYSSSSASTQTRSGALPRLIALLLSLVLIGASCGGSVIPIDDEVARLFDISGNRIADLTSDDSTEDVPSNELQQAIARADSAGTALRVVVTPADADLASAKSIVDRYGGTVLSYKANDGAFEGASRDISAAQLDRAIAAAKERIPIGDSAAAFVGVLESEGIESPGGAGPLPAWLLWLLLGLAGIFMLVAAFSYWKARKGRLKRQRVFAERKETLTSWAAQLGPEVEALRPLVAASPSNEAQSTWHESQDFVGSIQSTLDQARGPEELDAAEMRIGRVAIKLRDLRRSLES